MGFHGIQLLGLGMVGFGIASTLAGSGTIWAFFGLLVTFFGMGLDPWIDQVVERERPKV